MFKKIILSKHLRRRVSWFIAAILILPFVLFFHATGRRLVKGPGGIAGIIFGKRIAWDTFQEQQRWMRRQLETQLGTIPEALLPLLTQYTWDRLILLEEAKREHLRVSDEELSTFIQRIPAFQEQGRFLTDRYYRFLQGLRTSPQLFEQLLRNDLLAEKLVNTRKQTVAVTDAEVNSAYLTEHERRRAVLVFFDSAAFVPQAQASLTDQEVRAYYDTHPDEFRLPEQLVVAYAGVTREDLRARTHPGEDALQAFYHDHQSQFAKPDGTIQPYAEVREAVTSQVIDAQVTRQLKALALDLTEDLEGKLSFDEIVLTRALTVRSVGPLSVDPALVTDGPEPALLEALRSLPEGQLSDVIETGQGTYVGRVTQRIPPRLPPFEAIRSAAQAHAVHWRARDAAKSAAQTLHATLKEQLMNGMRFEEAALADGPLPVHPVQITRTQSIEPIGSVPAVNDAAFRLPLGTLSDVIETPSGFVMIRPEERMAPDSSTLAEASPNLRERLLSRKQSEQLEQWLRELRGRAKLQSFVELPDAEAPASP